MHPALSVIIFTTASGAGYGLLALTGVLVWNGMMPMDRPLGIAVMGLGLALVSGGLLSSTWHLGHPERAWRAFSQWQSSWLSREGVAAVITYMPACLLAWCWVMEEPTGGLMAWSGLALSILSLVTVFCTAMIYRSLATIPQWNNSLTVPCYLTFGIMTGTLILNAVLYLLGGGASLITVLCVIFCISGFLVKQAYWLSIDGHSDEASMGSATGLQDLGQVQPFEAPHSSDNYLMKEMGYQIARKHVQKLRRIVMVFGFLAPLALSVAAMLTDPVIGGIAVVLAVLSATLGIIVERWLFFSEAKHVVMHYYR